MPHLKPSNLRSLSNLAQITLSSNVSANRLNNSRSDKSPVICLAVDFKPRSLASIDTTFHELYFSNQASDRNPWLCRSVAKTGDVGCRHQKVAVIDKSQPFGVDLAGNFTAERGVV